MKCVLVVLLLTCAPLRAMDAERTTPQEKCIIFRDTDAAKVNVAVNNFLATSPLVTRVLQSESAVRMPEANYAKERPSGNVLTITIFYREKP